MFSGLRSRTVVGAVAVAALLAAGVVAYLTVRDDHRASAFSPEVRHTGTAPTGYVVTFRYRDPSATSVLIHGEWYFSDPTVTTSTSSQGLLPAEWKRGDVATGWPAPSTPDGWPVTEMAKDPSTGVWSYSIPLPSGYYNYGFYVDCTIGEALSSPDQTVGCTDPEVADPSNPAWNDRHGVSTGSSDGRSEVYVPADPAFDNVNNSWEGPTTPKGKLTDVSYTSLADVSAPGRLAMNYLAIYTPHGYDAHRAKLYPTLYLSPGAGLNEVDWSTQGDAANILDNLIDKHRIEPLVVVMTSTSCRDCDPMTASATDYDQDLLLDVIPYVQARYDVSKDPSQRAFAGFSAGGWAAGSLLVDDANMFGSFGLFSPCPASVDNPTPAQAAAIKLVRVMIGGGNEDPDCHPYAAGDVAAVQSAGVNPDTEFFYGGHDWDVWRILLKDFLTNVAFKPAGT